MIEIEKDRKTKTAVVCPIVRTAGVFWEEADIKAREEEAAGLVLAMGQAVVLCESVKLTAVAPGSFFGKGTLERLKRECLDAGAGLLAVDGTLTPVQQRNLEKALELKVIDRTAVILEIFGRRAQTKEGKLQVELAHLTYQRGRLVRSWTHLERQRGGGGFLGGPGETQIELDRRHIDERIIKIKKELEKVRRTRSIQRAARVRVPYPSAALVGYTNAGKSTLFNRLSGASVTAQDMLFATLDPTVRKIRLDDGTEMVLSDTVGFISNLPHELIMAFRATLEEVLLHELGLQKIEYEPNYIEVFNKIDLLDEAARENLLARLGGGAAEMPEAGKVATARRNSNAAAVSAVNGSGIAYLRGKIQACLAKKAG